MVGVSGSMDDSKRNFTVTHIWGDGLHTLKQFLGFQQCKGMYFGSPACDLIAALILVSPSESTAICRREWFAGGLSGLCLSFSMMRSLCNNSTGPWHFCDTSLGFVRCGVTKHCKEKCCWTWHVVAGLQRKHLLYFKETRQLLWKGFRI